MATVPSTERLVYADSSALVKLVVQEPESAALERHLEDCPVLATSRIALLEVPRAAALANPAAEVQREAERLLASCLLVDVSDVVLRAAGGLVSPGVRTLAAIHIASALRVEPDEFVSYDRHLVSAASEQGLVVTYPGARS
jgi:predicted nucleic acid-binding protein